MFDFSPEDVRGYPKADKRKTERKGHTKGKNIVATNTPEIKSIVQNKNNRKKASRVNKSLFVKKKEGDSHSGDDNIEKMILDHSDKDSEFMEELISSLR
jgi:hypothetical protein